jgi:hypothetical protein
MPGTYLADAYVSDHRVGPVITLINALFLIERQSDKLNHTPEQRLNYRNLFSRGIVEKIMGRLREIRASGNEFGQLVHRAVNYILDDEEAYRRFLLDGNLAMNNNAIERCFRHIAMGRRTYLYAGSHKAAENIAFIYSLVESSKLNHLNFGEYIEDVLNRVVEEGEDKVDFATLIPCNYQPKAVDSKVSAA